mgnify:CR=1 FL=1
MKLDSNNYFAATEETFPTSGFYGVYHYFRDAEGLEHEKIVCDNCLTLDDAKSIAKELNAQNATRNEED